MTTDWVRQAICMFFHDYVAIPKKAAIGTAFLQNVPEMCGKEKEMSALTQAVSAVALTSLANRTSLDYLSVQARQRYGNALPLVTKSICGQEEMKADSTLAAILCLDFYEIVSGEKPPGSKRWSCHVDILEYILRARGTDQTHSTESHSLTYNAVVYLQMRNLNQHNHPSKESEALVRSPIRELPLRQNGILVCETCHFLARVDEIFNEATTIPSTSDCLSEIIQAGLALDERLEFWPDQLPEDYRYTSIQTPNCASENTLGPHPKLSCHLYSSSPMAPLWNLHRITRILLLANLVKCISMLAGDGAQQMAPTELIDYSAQAVNKIQSLADDICASVPYLLGEIDQDGMLRHPRHTKAIGGFYLLFPLRSMLFVKVIHPVKKAWIRKRLAYIKNTFGIQEALMDERHLQPAAAI
ncbi:MAG: hypothetical protein M1827_004198 [Pycnora praestabilis]|nr:MAG: hypothetical protein M1827_004198 [Pycnora praestabilis]